jgi:hypothetical protein
MYYDLPNIQIFVPSADITMAKYSRAGGHVVNDGIPFVPYEYVATLMTPLPPIHLFNFQNPVNDLSGTAKETNTIKHTPIVMNLLSFAIMNWCVHLC